MLVVWGKRVNGRAYVYSMSKMEKTEKEIRLRVRNRRCSMATAGREKMVGGPARG